MHKGLFVLFLTVLVVLVGYPYAAWVLNHMLGTHSVVMTEHDGTQRTLIMGPDAPHPEWLAVMPGALVVSAGRWLPSPSQADEGDLDILTHAGFDDIRRFYMDGLQAQGFAMKTSAPARSARRPPPISASIACFTAIARKPASR